MKRLIVSLSSFFLVSAALALEHEPITAYEVHFSAPEKLVERFVALIKAERSSIKLSTYSLMHRSIANALIEAHERGVHVEIVVDPFSIKTRGPSKKLAKSELPFYVWNPKQALSKKTKQKKQTLNDTFCVFGKRTVWTGALNFTGEIGYNSPENVVVLEQEAIAQAYLKEFEDLKLEKSLPYAEYLKIRNKGVR